MSQNPSRPHRDARRAQTPRMPTLGTVCRQFREHCGYTREEANSKCGVSQSYMYRIEEQEHWPSPEILERLVTGYDLDSGQARHLSELCAPAERLEPVHVLRHQVLTNAAQMSHLDHLEKLGALAAYIDPVWSILATNNLFRRSIPGADETGSIPVWLFSPTARRLVLDWDREADHTVAILKGILGRHRDSPQSIDLFRRLRRNTYFQDRWIYDIRVEHGRDDSIQFRLRDPKTAAVSGYRLSISDETNHVWLLTGFPIDELSVPNSAAADSPPVRFAKDIP